MSCGVAIIVGCMEAAVSLDPDSYIKLTELFIKEKPTKEVHWWVEQVHSSVFSKKD